MKRFGIRSFDAALSSELKFSQKLAILCLKLPVPNQNPVPPSRETILGTAPELNGLNTRGIGFFAVFGPLGCVGLNHLSQFAATQTRRGCIDRCGDAKPAKCRGVIFRESW